MNRVFYAKHWIGDVVFLRLRGERQPGMVTQVAIRLTGVLYGVTWGNGTESYHYDIELSLEYVPDYAEHA
jgi:hypothetical protein